MDYLTIGGLTHEHEGDPDQWAPVFMNQPDTWRLLIGDNDSIVGYWHAVSLLPDVYKIAKSGRLIDSELTVDKVSLMDFEGKYDLYVVSVGLLEKYRTRKNKQLLAESFYDALDKLAQEEIYVREVIANAYSAEGVALCKSFGMTEIGSHIDTGLMFCASFGSFLEH